MLLRRFKRGLSTALAVYALPLLFRWTISLGNTSHSLATRVIRSLEPVYGDVDDSRCLGSVLRRSSRGAEENRHPGNLRIESIDYEMAIPTSLQTAVQCTALAMPTERNRGEHQWSPIIVSKQIQILHNQAVKTFGFVAAAYKDRTFHIPQTILAFHIDNSILNFPRMPPSRAGNLASRLR
jgi:hypothetical protein